MTQSQNKQVLQHLQAGKAISTWTAIKTFNITRLSARIKNLRDSGVEIYGKMVEHGKKRYKVYYLRESNAFEIHGKSY